MRPVRQTFSSTYSSDGTAVEYDNSGLLLELLDNTYYHLTGTIPAQEGYRIHLLSTEDFWRVTDEEGAPPGHKAAAGWCCREKDDGSHMYVNADNLLPRALAIVFHEVGHSLHDILNPDQWREWDQVFEYPDEIRTWRAHVEAIAMAFEAANIRILGEQTGVETSGLPAGWHIPDSYIDSILTSPVTLPGSEVYGQEAYDRGRLLIWTAVLTDPDLSHLRREFESNGRLSGSSLYEVFLKFVNMGGDEIVPYIDSVTPDDLSAVRQVVFDTVRQRYGLSGLDYPELRQGIYDSIVLP